MLELTKESHDMSPSRSYVSAGSAVLEKQIICAFWDSYLYKQSFYICCIFYYCKICVKCSGYNKRLCSLPYDWKDILTPVILGFDIAGLLKRSFFYSLGIYLTITL